jgi:predicted nuclease of predicted toxin-antitoxin system
MAAVKFYFDEMMPRPAAQQLSKRGIDVVMANDVGMTQKTDTKHLTYATENDYVLVTFDRKFAGLSMANSDHTGLVCLKGSPENVGVVVTALAEFAEQHTAEDAKGHVFWL